MFMHFAGSFSVSFAARIRNSHSSKTLNEFLYITFFLQNSIHVTFSGLGVIWKGDELIDGASQTLDMLRSKVTN